MVSQRFTTLAVALAASTLASAQTETKCNPLTTSCPPDDAFGNDAVNCDWTSGSCPAFTVEAGTTLTYGSNGAVFSIKQQSDAPTIITGKYIFFGRLDVELQAAPGAGVVTSAVLQSDDLDEIDWEWVGDQNTEAQSNYFSKGDTSTYTRGEYHPVSAPVTSFHTYSVEWTPASVEWLIDNVVVRTLTYSNATGGTTFPQTPMQVKIGTWVGGCATCAPGTTEWAGGDYNQAGGPYNAYYKSVAITDYAGGSSPPAGAIKEYIYGDHSGTYQSIKVVKGDGSSSGDSSSSSSSKTSKTSSAPPKSTHKTSTSTTSSSTHTTTSTKAKKTTMSKATSTAHNSTTSASTKPTSTAAKTTATTNSAPASETTNAAARGSAAFGALVVAGAGVAMAQLF